MPAGKKSAGQTKPSQKQRRLKQKASARGHGAYVAETKASDDVPWRPKAVKPEVCDAVKFEFDDDEDKAVKSEDNDNDDHDNDDHDNDNEDWMTQLSHNMANYPAHCLQ